MIDAVLVSLRRILSRYAPIAEYSLDLFTMVTCELAHRSAHSERCHYPTSRPQKQGYIGAAPPAPTGRDHVYGWLLRLTRFRRSSPGRRSWSLVHYQAPLANRAVEGPGLPAANTGAAAAGNAGAIHGAVAYRREKHVPALMAAARLPVLVVSAAWSR